MLMSSTSSNSDPKICAICTDEISAISNENDDIIQLPCHHEFHKKCIITSFCTRNTTCPLCRYNVDHHFFLQSTLQYLNVLLKYDTDGNTLPDEYWKRHADKPLRDIYWLFRCVLCLLYQYPNSARESKPQLAQAIQGLESFAAFIFERINACHYDVPKEVYQLAPCGHMFDADYIVLWLLNNGNGDMCSCPICRVKLSKEVIIQFVVRRFVITLRHRKLAWHHFWLFWSICDLAIKEPQDVGPIHAPHFPDLVKEIYLFAEAIL